MDGYFGYPSKWEENQSSSKISLAKIANARRGSESIAATDTCTFSETSGATGPILSVTFLAIALAFRSCEPQNELPALAGWGHSYHSKLSSLGRAELFILRCTHPFWAVFSTHRHCPAFCPYMHGPPTLAVCFLAFIPDLLSLVECF